MPRRKNRGFHSAFTLLELLVVIGIIALLLAIAVPATTRLIDNQKRNNTYANMQVIEGAISSFEQTKPLKGKYKSTSWGSPGYLWGSPGYGNLPPDYALWQKDPQIDPTYETPWAPQTYWDLNQDALWEPGEPIVWDQPESDEGHARVNIIRLGPYQAKVAGTWDFASVAELDGVQRRVNGVWTPDDPPPGSVPVKEDYRSIETLYLYMTRFCPECQQQLARLPYSILTNADVCPSGPCPEKIIFGIDPTTTPPNTKADLVHGEQVDLMEIRDSWGKPMRYEVQPSQIAVDPNDPTRKRRLPTAWKWELRSAGPDGVFARDLSFDPNNYSGMFLPEDKSGDDVILSQR